MNKNATSLSSWSYFICNLKKGLRYALWLLLVGALMGGIYGLIAGVVIQPAAFTVAFFSVLVLANFIIALLVLPIYLLLLIFRKGSRPILRYFALSLSFVLVYVPVYWLLFVTGMEIF